MSELEYLKKAVNLLGGQRAFSKACGNGVTQQHVYNWLNRDQKLPEKYAYAVQAATAKKGDTVYMWQLCPMAFPKDVFQHLK